MAKKHTISPGDMTHNSLHARMNLTHKLVRLFNRQKTKAVHKVATLWPTHLKVWLKEHDPAEKKKLAKASADEIAAALYAEIMDEWERLPEEAKEDLVAAAESGAAKGAVQLRISDVEVISAVNATARDWAEKRAAELVGMRWTDDGDLVPNPNAQWRISDTTRDELRRIVASAFEKETPLDVLTEEIKTAGAFSSVRAELIARTEIQFAQVSGNYAAWQESGLVESVTSILSADHEVEDECDDNDGVVVRLGEPFPSGDLAPPYHPRCMCVIATAELVGEQE